MLDLDGLKAINDQLGHQAGDERIQGLADAIRDSRRATDVGYRIGGDEFAVILPGSRALGALEFAERVRALAAATVGIAEATTLRSRDDVLREADLALIGAKRLGQAVAVYGARLRARRARAGAPREHAGQRARPGRGRQGLLHPQPLPDRLPAVRGDRCRARAGRRAGRAHPPRRPAARRRQDRRAGRHPQQAVRPHRRRVRDHEAALAAGRRHRRGGRDARGGALGAPPPRALRRQRLPRRPGRRGHPDRVPHHPRRRRVRGDDLGPPLPQGARASSSPSASCSATPASQFDPDVVSALCLALDREAVVTPRGTS